MIAVDTNILIRYITNDDPGQCKKAEKLLKQYPKPRDVYVSNIVLVETEWVLSSVYHFPKKDILRTLDAIAGISQFAFDNRESLLLAIEKFWKAGKDFSGCLIGEQGRIPLCKTYTFDKKLKTDGNFVVI